MSIPNLFEEIPEIKKLMMENNKMLKQLLANQTGPQEREKKLVTVNIAATKIGCCRQTVYKYIDTGDLKCIKMGKTIRVDLSSIERLLQKNKNL